MKNFLITAAIALATSTCAADAWSAWDWTDRMTGELEVRGAKSAVTRPDGYVPSRYEDIGGQLTIPCDGHAGFRFVDPEGYVGPLLLWSDEHDIDVFEIRVRFDGEDVTPLTVYTYGRRSAYFLIDPNDNAVGLLSLAEGRSRVLIEVPATDDLGHFDFYFDFDLAGAHDAHREACEGIPATSRS